MKVVINNCYGGFSISKKAAEFMAEMGDQKAIEMLAKWDKRNKELREFKKTGKSPHEKGSLARITQELEAEYRKEARWYGYDHEEDRANPILVLAVEKLEEEAGGDCASLKVVEIPDDVEWTIQEYDGNEWVAEAHRTWGA